MHFHSGAPMHFHSGVDKPGRSVSARLVFYRGGKVGSEFAEELSILRPRHSPAFGTEGFQESGAPRADGACAPSQTTGFSDPRQRNTVFMEAWPILTRF